MWKVALLLVLAASQHVLTESVSTNKLVELIQKKNYDGFLQELTAADMDTTQPDSKGKLPIVEGVKTKNIKFVDALVQFGAAVAVKEPATGASPVQFAFQAGLNDIARLLISYGADLNVTDKTGKRPRDFTPNAELKEFIRLWDEKGAVAFEDAPGTWIKATNDKGESYWYNTKTSEARWNLPPSCAWSKVEYMGQPNKYSNYVTGQLTHKMPPSLSWRKIRQASGDIMWYNWAVNATQLEQPDELSKEMLEEAEKLVNVRWYNEVTKEFSFEDPKFHTQWRAIPQEGDKVYYYNVATGESTWETPEELAWTKMESSENPGAFFYHNTVTKESTWEKPAVQAWEKHADDF